jgi:PAS domain S-box-containing protein
MQSLNSLLLGLWRSWTEPFTPIEDDAARHHARVVAGFSGAVLLISAIMVVFTLPVLFLLPGSQLWLQLFGLLLFVMPYLMARAGTVKLAVLIHTLLAIVNLFFGAAALGGVVGVTVLYFAVTASIYAATFIGVTAAITVSLSVSIVMLFMSPVLHIPFLDILFGPVMFTFGGTLFFLLINLYWRQREELRRAALERSENRYRLMSELTSDYMFLVTMGDDGKPSVDWMTSSVEKITGYTVAEITQKSDSTVHPDDFQLVVADRLKVMAGETAESEYRFYHKDGSMRWALMNRQPQWNEHHSQIVGYYGAVRDITERKRAEQKLIETTLQREQYTMVHQLVSAMSHDFRNRLATIETSRYLIERFLQNNAEPRIASRMETIKLSANQMITQLDNLSLLAGLNETHPRPTELNYVCRFLHGQFINRVEQAGLHLKLELADGAINTSLDAVQFERAVGQLINNAIDHTPGGTITLRTLSDSTHAILEVEDTGSGIPADKLADIFVAFYKVSTARTISDSGLGLGLAIVKRIIEGHYGTIEVESEDGKGSLFRIRLPLLASDASA